jgi:ABC-type uncharacterized transport system substrate-binding protein
MKRALSKVAMSSWNTVGRRGRALAGACYELARQQVAVMVANPPSVLPAKAATATIPIVFTTSLDPVAAGIVRSLSRPGGNLTGITSLNVEMEPKRLELLHELVPAATVIAALVNPAGPNAEVQSTSLLAASRSLGLELHVLHASTEAELDRASTGNTLEVASAQRCLAHRMHNLAAKAPEDVWPELKV